MRLEQLGEKFWQAQREFFYASPTSVGSRIVAKVDEDEVHLGFQMVRLDFPEAVEGGLWISRVPLEYSFKKGQRAKILVRRERRDIRMLPVVVGELFMNRVESWLVAINPFYQAKDIEPVHPNDTGIQDMFLANYMDKESNPAFYERFIREKMYTPPPFRGS